MDDAWAVLEAAGVPTGPPRQAVRLDPDRLAAALGAVVDDPVDSDALLAWLSAFAHHWPSAFVALLGETGERARDIIAQRGYSRDRYLKLRRIAIANLARVL